MDTKHAPKSSYWNIRRIYHRAALLILFAIATLLLLTPSGSAISLLANLTGAIFTTNSGCGGNNINLFDSKDAVYLNGGPANSGSGLPDGPYYVKVTAPDGTLLGTSIGSGNDTPVNVTAGKFDACYKLSDILITANNSTPGYDDTPNNGDEYKVWVSRVSDFSNNETKTDNFKVRSNVLPVNLTVEKFYDANLSGSYDAGDTLLDGWQVRIQDGVDYIRYTSITIGLDPVPPYKVTESTPVETNWVRTFPAPADYISVSIADGSKTVRFGNVCLGAGGGLTLGFWSNKNGEKLFYQVGGVAAMNALNLRNANGSNFELPGPPTTAVAAYGTFRTWLLSATATNMAYMLSAQLAAMKLNVLNGNVQANSLIYAPGTMSADSLGFATVSQVIAEADAALGVGGNLNLLTLAGHPQRAYQEILKNVLDRANNNLNFAQAKPCPFSFAE
jgi:hypothetical protein